MEDCSGVPRVCTGSLWLTVDAWKHLFRHTILRDYAILGSNGGLFSCPASVGFLEDHSDHSLIWQSIESHGLEVWKQKLNFSHFQQSPDKVASHRVKQLSTAMNCVLKKACLTSHVSVSWITPSEQKRVFQTTFHDTQIIRGIQEAVAQTCLGRLGYLACVPNLCTNNCSLINLTIWVGTNCIYIPLKLPLIPNTSDFGVSNDFRRGTVAHEHACNKA